MSKGRRRRCVTIIGETDIGKTTAFCKMIDNYTGGMVSLLNYQGEPDLLARYREVPLYPEDGSPVCLAAQNSGVYQVVTTNWQGFIEECQKNFNKDSEKSGMVVFDDQSSYMPQGKYQPMVDLMVGLRHKRLDIINVHHQLMRVPPFIIDNTQTVILFKTGEDPDKLDPLRFRHGHRIIEAAREVEANPFKHFHKTIDLTGVEG